MGASSGDEERPLDTESQPENGERMADKAAISSQPAPKSTDSTSRISETPSDSRDDPQPPDPAIMAQFRKRIRCMEAASQKIMLQRLQEDWAESPDAEVYEEMEAEKQWWMLMAVRALYKEKRSQDIRVEKPKNTLQTGIRYAPARVLSLHESHGTFIFDQYFHSSNMSLFSLSTLISSAPESKPN